jgi:FAD/FMN-containing dehydrogenase
LVFETFFDAEDLSACVPAEETARSLNERARPLGCFFPLWLAPDQALGEFFLTARAAPASFRYGSPAHNVLGLNWILPSGRRVRFGGRVVKNVAGFDLVRLCSASHGRLGRPEHLILRLRPLAEAERHARLSGPWDGLRAAARTLRASSWSHVLDACDLAASPEGASLHLSFRGKASLVPLFEAEAVRWADAAGLKAEFPNEVPEPQAQPWGRAQTLADEAVPLARSWVSAHGGTVHAFLGQGVLQFQNPERPDAAFQELRGLNARLGALGGHCEHDGLAADPARPQARWETELLRRWQELP